MKTACLKGRGFEPYLQTINEPTIFLDFDQPWERLNFSYFHEVTHHLLKTDEDLISLTDECIDLKFRDEENIIESLANFGAAEFLIPTILVKQLINREDFSLKIIKSLDEMTNASKIACAVKLIENVNYKSVIMVCRFGFNPFNNQTQSQVINSQISQSLYAEYCFSSPQNKYHFSRGINIPKKHILHQAFDEGCHIVDRDFIPRKNGNRDWVVKTEAFYYKQMVFGHFYISEPIEKNPLQPSLF